MSLSDEYTDYGLVIAHNDGRPYGERCKRKVPKISLLEKLLESIVFQQTQEKVKALNPLGFKAFMELLGGFELSAHLSKRLNPSLSILLW